MIGEIELNTELDFAYRIWKENLMELLLEYKKYIAHIGSYHGVFLNPINDLFEKYFDNNITDFIPNNILKKAIYISDFTFSYEWDFNNGNKFILDDYVEEKENEKLLDKVVEYFNSLDKLEVKAVGYSQGDEIDAVLVLAPKTPKKIKKEIEGIFSSFKYLYTISDFTLKYWERETRQYIETGEIEEIDLEKDYCNITETESYITNDRLEEIRK